MHGGGRAVLPIWYIWRPESWVWQSRTYGLWCFHRVKASLHKTGSTISIIVFLFHSFLLYLCVQEHGPSTKSCAGSREVKKTETGPCVVQCRQAIVPTMNTSPHNAVTTIPGGHQILQKSKVSLGAIWLKQQTSGCEKSRGQGRED